MTPQGSAQSAQEHERIRRVKDAAEAELFRIPGVTGVGVGFKQVGGAPTDILAITVTVAAKQAQGAIPPGQLIPRAIQGIPTDVVEAAIRLGYQPVGDDTASYDPLVGGIKIGRCEPTADGGYTVGTLGLVVADIQSGRPMLLSNAHVLCGRGAWHAGDQIGQPSPHDSWIGRCAVVGELSRSQYTNFGLDGQVYGLDCAVAFFTAVDRRAMLGQIQDLGPATGVRTLTGQDVVERAVVRKRGQTTRRTEGRVVDVACSVRPQGSAITLQNQIRVAPTDGGPVLASGDSGSVLVAARNRVVGLLWGCNNAGTVAVANPIAPVLSALNIRIQPPP